MPWYYALPDSPDQLLLRPADAQHLTTVRRAKSGQEIKCVWGAQLWKVQISQVKPLILKPLERVRITAPSLPIIYLYAGLTKRDEFHDLLQFATQLGVSEITPVFCEYTQFKIPPEKVTSVLETWQKIIRGAGGQSERLILPKIHSPVTFRKLTSQLAGKIKLVGLTRNSQTTYLDKQLVTRDAAVPIRIVVGPEGGFSPPEIAAMKDSSWIWTRLAPYVLTSPVATSAFLAQLILHWQQREGQ